ncbi:hypothetical protein PR048_005394 [Dryococelus australis]|uniref:Uncharacterized protein n=1 Tax=Dryococelus australis TaxID=614101 RepID=A0ABQ9I833_9NEOP|nr:hypothetical protein PR048_005394 [Dryococelus australis]
MLQIAEIIMYSSVTIQRTEIFFDLSVKLGRIPFITKTSRKVTTNARKNVSSAGGEKQMDSNLSIEGECISACFDMQAVLPTLSGDISQFDYKRRLSKYKFTIFNMGTGFGLCWHESQAKCDPNEIGSCLHIFLQRNSVGKPIVFYSDNC